jgi:hypothetical protein
MREGESKECKRRKCEKSRGHPERDQGNPGEQGEGTELK